MSRYYGTSAFMGGLMKGFTFGAGAQEAYGKLQENKADRKDKERVRAASATARQVSKAAIQSPQAVPVQQTAAIPTVSTAPQAQAPTAKTGMLSDEYSPPEDKSKNKEAKTVTTGAPVKSPLEKLQGIIGSNSYGEDKPISDRKMAFDEPATGEVDSNVITKSKAATQEEKITDAAFQPTPSDGGRALTSEDMKQPNPLITSDRSGGFNVSTWESAMIDTLPWDATPDQYAKVHEMAISKSKAEYTKSLYRAEFLIKRSAESRAAGDEAAAANFDKGAALTVAQASRAIPNGQSVTVQPLPNGQFIVAGYAAGTPDVRTETYGVSLQTIQGEIARITGPNGDEIFGKIVTPQARFQAEQARAKQIDNEWAIANKTIDMYSRQVSTAISVTNAANGTGRRSLSGTQLLAAQSALTGSFNTAATQQKAVQKVADDYSKLALDVSKYNLDKNDANLNPMEISQPIADDVIYRFFSQSMPAVTSGQGMAGRMAGSSPNETSIGIITNVAYRWDAENRGVSTATNEKQGKLTEKEVGIARNKFISRKKVGEGSATGYEIVIRDITGNVIHRYNEPISSATPTQQAAIYRRKGVSESMAMLGIEQTTIDTPVGPTIVWRVKGTKVTKKDVYEAAIAEREAVKREAPAQAPAQGAAGVPAEGQAPAQAPAQAQEAAGVPVEGQAPAQAPTQAQGQLTSDENQQLIQQEMAGAQAQNAAEGLDAQGRPLSQVNDSAIKFTPRAGVPESSNYGIDELAKDAIPYIKNEAKAVGSAITTGANKIKAFGKSMAEKNNFKRDIDSVLAMEKQNKLSAENAPVILAELIAMTEQGSLGSEYDIKLRYLIENLQSAMAAGGN